MGLGLAVGLVITWSLSRVLAGLLFAVTPTDGPTTIAVVFVVAGVGAVATLVPSWRATAVNPVAVLRRG